MIDELPGHHIDQRRQTPVVTILKCQCGWVVPTHVNDVDDTQQLHWAAKICESEVLEDIEAEIRSALFKLDEVLADPLWHENLNR